MAFYVDDSEFGCLLNTLINSIKAKQKKTGKMGYDVFVSNSIFFLTSSKCVHEHDHSDSVKGSYNNAIIRTLLTELVTALQYDIEQSIDHTEQTFNGLLLHVAEKKSKNGSIDPGFVAKIHEHIGFLHDIRTLRNHAQHFSLDKVKSFDPGELKDEGMRKTVKVGEADFQLTFRLLEYIYEKLALEIYS